MSGRYLEDNCRVLALCGLLLITLSLSARGVEESDSTRERYIVRTSQVRNLYEYALSGTISVTTLINYPDPSQEVQILFGDYYLVTVSSHSKTSKQNVLKDLKGLQDIDYIVPDEIIHIETKMESVQENRVLDEPAGSAYTPDDPMYEYQWDKVITNTDWAWTVAKGDSIVIAILDSGVDTDHLDLKTNLIPGYNFLDGNGDVEDYNGHGTRVSGTAAARIDNAEGIAGIAGNASIMPLKVVDNLGRLERSDEINAILYAVDNGAKVINMSFGFDSPNEAEEKAIEYAWNKGLFLCSSAGNNGDYNPNHYPSSYEHVMSVGSTTDKDARAEFSGYGSNVDVYAPGKRIWQTIIDGSYGTGSGTSFSSPQIAGLAALIWDNYPEYTNQQVWNAVIKGADSIETDKGILLRMNAKGSLEVKPETNSDITLFENRNMLVRIETPSIQNGQIKFVYDAPTSISYSLSIYNVNGSVVYSKHGTIESTGYIDCSTELSSGTYFWRVKTDLGILNGKVVLIK